MPRRLALLFPGQGAQRVGMGRDLHAAFPIARATYEEAAEATGVDFARLSFEGPEEELLETRNAQPAILVHSVACLRILAEHGIEGDIAAGHSLGEYSAHVAAGSLAFRDAVGVVRRRGELMHEAGRERPGAMAAILGLALAEVEPVIAGAREAGVVVAANLNGPAQIVVSGEIPAVERAVELARAAGAKRAVRLEVAGAFHSPLMASAGAGLRAVLEATPIADARIPVIANATARPVRRADEIRATLAAQLLEPVRWEESMRVLGGARGGGDEATAGVAGGASALEAVELGPGSVLRGLLRGIAPEVRVHPAGDRAAVEAAVGELGGTGAGTRAAGRGADE